MRVAVRGRTSGRGSHRVFAEQLSLRALCQVPFRASYLHLLFGPHSIPVGVLLTEKEPHFLGKEPEEQRGCSVVVPRPHSGKARMGTRVIGCANARSPSARDTVVRLSPCWDQEHQAPPCELVGRVCMQPGMFSLFFPQVFLSVRRTKDTCTFPAAGGCWGVKLFQKGPRAG